MSLMYLSQVASLNYLFTLHKFSVNLIGFKNVAVASLLSFSVIFLMGCGYEILLPWFVHTVHVLSKYVRYRSSTRFSL
jgi:hypothetical protein